MNKVNRAIGCFVLFAIIGLVVMPASGAVDTLGTPLTGWTGSTTFLFESLSPPFKLTGTVAWAVYGPGAGDFSPTFYLGDTYTATPNEYVYAYQIFNDKDSVNISQYLIPPTGEADNIGFFREESDSAGIKPDSTDISISKIWNFSPSIGPGAHSSILVFSSSHPPMMSGSIITDHGSTADVLPVPTPIPEPASVLVWLIGLGLCLAPTVSRRWKR